MRVSVLVYKHMPTLVSVLLCFRGGRTDAVGARVTPDQPAAAQQHRTTRPRCRARAHRECDSSIISSATTVTVAMATYPAIVEEVLCNRLYLARGQLVRHVHGTSDGAQRQHQRLGGQPTLVVAGAFRDHGGMHHEVVCICIFGKSHHHVCTPEYCSMGRGKEPFGTHEQQQKRRAKK